ncbi:MAG: gluconate 2-dehydrogenase subunit 3 family protein [Bacteroidota bacterium]
MNRRDALRNLTAVVGAGLALPVYSGMLAGCNTGPVTPPYVPQTLTPEQHNLLGVLVQQILPETETPGAADVGVHDFIDRLLTGFLPDEAREPFIAGLVDVEDRSMAAFGVPFVEASSEQQIALMTELDFEAYPETQMRAEMAGDHVPDPSETALNEQNPQAETPESEAVEDDAHASEPEGPPFFATLKGLTLWGYYTSEVGATQELQLNPMGEFRGDIPLSEVGRSYA